MKATGIVRRIDDLGRIVIPKEIRRNLRIKEGDPMEIFLADEGIVFKKYEPLNSTLDLTNLENFLADNELLLSENDCEILTNCIKAIRSVRENVEREG